MLDTHVSLRDLNATLGAELGTWIATQGAFPGAARAAARRAFIDIVGCLTAGATDPATRVIQHACAAWGDGPSTVIASGRRQAAPWAALANGTAAHALDFDDTFEPARAHITAVLAPALLALAEERGLSGGAVIDAYIAGTEIAARLGARLNPGHRDSGWHATSTIGAIAAAGACARLLNLGAEHTAHALNTATSFAGGTMAQFGTAMKAVHAGQAAAAGVMAASFAAAGLEAGARALDGRYGMVAMMNGATKPAGNEPELALLTHGLKVKRHACCASAHRAIDAILELRDAHRLQPQDVSRIDIQAPPRHLANMMFDTPTDAREARFSLPYCAALAVVRGHISLGDFADDSLAAPALRQIMERVMSQPHDAGNESAHVEIACADGRRLALTVTVPHGHIARPLSDAELWSKFDTCCADLSAPRRDALKDALTHFDSNTPASALLAPFGA